MIQYNDYFGYQIYGDTIGEAWLDLLECVLKNGELEMDEKRRRFALQNVRVRVKQQKLPDLLLEKFADKNNINEMIRLVFKDEVMEDMDITPSFMKGAKSYFARIKEGRMIDFVVKRLTEIPESKKAVIVFPTYEDYAKVLNSPYNDYLPCIVSIQIRLRPKQGGGWIANTIFNMRSSDIYQKFPGNLTVITMMAQSIAERLSKNLNTEVLLGYLDGTITDVHLYQNTFNSAQAVSISYLESKYSDKHSGKLSEMTARL